MKENIEKRVPIPNFVISSLEYEIGEIERVSTLYGFSAQEFVGKLHNSVLVTLSEDIWSKLENTDSFAIQKGDWNTVEDLASLYGKDLNRIKAALQTNKTIEAPIILKLGSTYHLVGGNTRLMAARAQGVVPKVVIVEM